MASRYYRQKSHLSANNGDSTGIGTINGPIVDCASIGMSNEQAGFQNADAAVSSGRSSPDNVQIVKAIADHEETDPLNLDFVLGEEIDTEALETVLDADADNVHVTFTVDGLVVTVASDGTIMIADEN